MPFRMGLLAEAVTVAVCADFLLYWQHPLQNMGERWSTFSLN